MPWSALTSLGSLSIQWCGKLRALPRGISKLGALRELTLRKLDELQEMPDLIWLTALDSLTIGSCGKLSALPRGLYSLSVFPGEFRAAWHGVGRTARNWCPMPNR